MGKVIFTAGARSSVKMLPLPKFVRPSETLQALFLTEFICFERLKELSESPAKVTQSLPVEVVATKGWGLLATSASWGCAGQHTGHGDMDSGLLCPFLRLEMPVPRSGHVPCARLLCNWTENIL